MGIPSYFSKIIKEYAAIIRNMNILKDVSFDHCFMDCNSIIYDCVHELDQSMDKSIFEKTLVENVIQKIKYYTELIKPSKTLYIAFDGVAPFAKMEQQRTRRYKTYFTSTLSFTNEPNKDKWNTSAITPGTEFMKYLSEQIQYAFSYLENTYQIQNIIVSSSDECGEGEHKLFEYVRSQDFKQDNVFLYGLDSDLIMLSIYHLKYCKNIYIFREAPEFIKNALPITVKENNDTDIYFLDIFHLANCIIQNMSCVDKKIERAYDYIFLCFLLGNDFLPHFPAMNIRSHGIDTLLSIYKNTIGNSRDSYLINKNGNINWKNVRTILTEISKNETTFIQKEYSSRNRFDNYKYAETTTKEKELLFQNTPIIYRQQEKYINPTIEFWELRYYKSLFNQCPTKEFIREIATNYLEGLEWVYKYYTKGCVDWKWKYKYHYPPLFVDLVKQVPHFAMDFLKEKPKMPFCPEVQLCYVLPSPSHFLLPTKIQTFIANNYKELYPDHYTFEWAFCRYFWESHPMLPTIPVTLLECWNTQFLLHR